MLSLPTDIQLLVLDYINTKSNLKALCLTSQHVRKIALPRLYHTVYLRTWDAHLVEFFQSVAAGAGLHLRHTRALLFEDERPPVEPVSGQTTDLLTGLSIKDERIYLALVMFPPQKLHTVGICYI